MKLLRKLWLIVFLLGNASSAFSEIIISNAWLRLLPPTITTTAAYMDITSDVADTLLEVSSPMAGRIEIHQSSMKDGMMSMSHVEHLKVPKNRKVSLSPQGYHLMVIGLKEPLSKEKVYTMEFHFEHAGPVKVQVPVQ